MRVWVVQNLDEEDVSSGWGTLQGLFSTKEKALEFVKSIPEAYKSYYSIYPMEVDNP